MLISAPSLGTIAIALVACSGCNVVEKLKGGGGDAGAAGRSART